MTFDQLIAEQRKHYEHIETQSRQRFIELGIGESDAAAALHELRTLLDADLQRFEREARALFDRGGRHDESAH